MVWSVVEVIVHFMADEKQKGTGKGQGPNVLFKIMTQFHWPCLLKPLPLPFGATLDVKPSGTLGKCPRFTCNVHSLRGSQSLVRTNEALNSGQTALIEKVRLVLVS